MEQNQNFTPERGLEQEAGGLPAEYRQYIPLGALAGAAGLGLAIARMVERRRQRQRSLRYRSERLMAQALGVGGQATDYVREHGEEVARLLEKRTRDMRKQLRHQARDANKVLHARAGGVVERVREQDYDRLRAQTAERLERLSGLLAIYGGMLAQRSQRTAHTLAHRAQGVAHETPEVLQRVGDLAQDLTATLRQSLQSTTVQLSERAQALASSAPETLRHAGDLTAERTQQLAATLQERAADTAQEARRKSKRGQIGLRALLLGLAVGLLLAPRKGEELREQMRRSLDNMLSNILRSGDAHQGAKGQQEYDPAI